MYNFFLVLRRKLVTIEIGVIAIHPHTGRVLFYLLHINDNVHKIVQN